MSTNTLMFPGSKDVYVQYHDILGIPMFYLLQLLINGKVVPGLYNVGALGRLPIEQLIQWYMIRSKFNFLQIPWINAHHLTDDENDRMMHQLLNEVSYIGFSPVNLINAFLLHPIVEHLHVYSRYDEPRINEVAQSMVKNVQTVDYRYGEFSDIVRDATDHASLITTSTGAAKHFLASKHPHRYVSLIYPNMYDPLQNISDVYSKYSDRIGVIDIRGRIQLWKETVT